MPMVGDNSRNARGRIAGLALILLSAMAAPTGAAASTTDAPIAAGNNFTCALTGQGGVRCWGNNFFGQLGDGTTTNQNVPVSVRSLSSGINSLAAGNGHACALSGGGGVECWGDNQFGQLGDGTTTERHRPVNVKGLRAGVIAIAAGQDSTCALLQTGIVKCWGYNAVGNLGDGTINNRNTPVRVLGLRGIVAIAAGSLHGCAVTDAGGVKCWGKNDSGQLGDGTNLGRLRPVNVKRISSGVASLSAGGSHTCAVLGTGAVECWGANQFGQLGDGSKSDRNKPVAASTLIAGAHLTALGPLASHTCVVTQDFRVMCWGFNNLGQLGDGATKDSKVARRVKGVIATNMAVGSSHTCARAQSGVIHCWGANAQGELGDGTFDGSTVPVTTQGF